MNVAVLSESADGPAVLAALLAGARGYLLKPISRCELEEKLRVLARGQPVLAADALRSLVCALNRASAGVDDWIILSPREKQVLAYLSLGLWSKEIALTLGITDGAVHRYLHNAFRKLGVHSKRDAVKKVMGLWSAFVL